MKENVEEILLEDIEKELKAREKIIADEKKANSQMKNDEIIDITEEEDLINLASNDENFQSVLSLAGKDQGISREETQAKVIYNSKIVEETRKLINEKNSVDRLSKVIDSEVIAEAKVILF